MSPTPPNLRLSKRRLAIATQYIALSIATIALIILLERGASWALVSLKLQSKTFDLPTLISLASGGAVGVRWVWGKIQRVLSVQEELRQRVNALEAAQHADTTDDSTIKKLLEDIKSKLNYLEIRVDYNDGRLNSQERDRDYERRRRDRD